MSRSQSEVTSTTSSPSSSPTSSFLPQHHHPQHSKPKITKPLESSNVRSSSPATTPSQFPFVNSLPPSGISSPVSQGPSPTDPLFSPPIPFNTQVPIHFGHKQQYVLDDRSRLRLILTGILVITLLMSGKYNTEGVGVTKVSLQRARIGTRRRGKGMAHPFTPPLVPILVAHFENVNR